MQALYLIAFALQPNERLGQNLQRKETSRNVVFLVSFVFLGFLHKIGFSSILGRMCFKLPKAYSICDL